MAMPLLVQLHLRPGPQLALAIVRQELLQGAFHALHHLCMQHGATSAVPRRSKPSSRVQSQAAPVTCRLKRLHAAEPAGCAQALGKEFRVVRRQPVRERRRLYGAAAESVCTRAKPGGTAETTPGWRGVLSSRTVRQEHIITRTAHVRRFQMSRTALAVTPYLAASCTHSRQCRCTCTARRRFRRPSRLAHVTCIHSTVIAAKRSRAPRHSGSSDQVAAAGLLTQQDARQADALLARSRKCTPAWHSHLAASRA